MDRIIPNEYKTTPKVASYDTDVEDRMRLSALLRYQQEAGEQHLEKAGMGWQAMSQMGMVFVTSRWRTAIHRLPRLEETVTLTTWHRDRKGPRFSRCYTWQAADGTLLVEGVMQFALVSVDTHRLLRGDEFMACAPLPDTPRTVGCGDPARITLGEQTEAGVYRVRWSDLDRNGHMNNTHYADLVQDFLPAHRLGAVPALVDLHFVGESRLGDTIAVSHTEEETATTLVGENPRGRTFAARLTWGDR